jgi:hypothetical protein
MSTTSPAEWEADQQRQVLAEVIIFLYQLDMVMLIMN